MSKIKSVGHEIIDLNEEQLKAIMDLKNNIYLKGRPGTGKSEAILQRTVNILNKGYAKEREILLIVSKNINEIRLRNKLERTDIKWDRINIMTIKKFCVRLVRLEGTNKLKVSNNWSFVDDNDSVEILKGILKENEILKEINKSVESIYEGLKKDKLNNILDNEILNKYNEYLFKNNLLDYLDVLSYADTLLEEKDISDF
ncbi:UvrD-helicase domain-containing protein, partial [Clostridium chrysemydis]